MVRSCVKGILYRICILFFYIQSPLHAGITGHVTNGETPIKGAKVFLANFPNKIIYTDDNGEFDLAVASGVVPASIGLARDKNINISSNQISFVLPSIPTNITVQFISLSGAFIASRKFTGQNRFNISLEEMIPRSVGAQVVLLMVSLEGRCHLFKMIISKNAIRSASEIGSKARNKKSIRSLPTMSAATAIDTVIIRKVGYMSKRLPVESYTADLGEIILNSDTSNNQITDADGNVYRCIIIGNQIWTVENLRTTKYNDGTDIPHVTVQSEWSDMSTPGYCFYDNDTDPAEQEKWGALYNWYAVNTGKLAPSGWRVPTDADWDTLQNYLIANGYNWDGSTSDNKIGKSLASKTDWVTTAYYEGSVAKDIANNNSTDFSALPGGYRSDDGRFYIKNKGAYFWSSTEYEALGVCYRYLGYNSESLVRTYSYDKRIGFHVRLLRD